MFPPGILDFSISPKTLALSFRIFPDVLAQHKFVLNYLEFSLFKDMSNLRIFFLLFNTTFITTICFGKFALQEMQNPEIHQV